MFYVIANTDTGMHLKVVDADTVHSPVNLGWVIIARYPTKREAEKGLILWGRSPIKLQRKLDEKIMY
jgi:hypothetical protein